MAFLMVYTRMKDAHVEKNEALVINSIHLAYWEGDTYTRENVFTALNDNTGILFAKTDYSKNSLIGDNKTLLHPRINPIIDETGSEGRRYQVTAQCGDDKGNLDAAHKGKRVAFYTKDFIHYTEQTWIKDKGLSNVNEELRQVSYYDVASDKVCHEVVKMSQIIEVQQEQVTRLKHRYGSLHQGELPLEEVSQTVDCSACRIDNYADPIMCYNQETDRYYFMGTNGPDGNLTLTIRESESLDGLVTAEPIPLGGTQGYSYEIGVNDDNRRLLLWAPELHKIGDYWYCLFTSGGEKWDGQRSYIMKNRTGQLADPNAWEKPTVFMQKDGVSPLYDKGITLDMTYIHDGHEHYVVWAQRETPNRGGRGVGNSDLYIGRISPDNPGVLLNDPVRIAIPEYGWEKRTGDVLEGPYAIIKGKTLYLVYSGSAVDETYCVGCMTAQIGDDLMDPDVWTKMEAPLLTTDNGGEKGPGHCSFTLDRYGNELFIYHYFPGSYSTRSTRVRQLRWTLSGVPILYFKA